MKTRFSTIELTIKRLTALADRIIFQWNHDLFGTVDETAVFSMYEDDISVVYNANVTADNDDLLDDDKQYAFKKVCMFEHCGLVAELTDEE